MDWKKLCDLCWKLGANMTKQSLAKSGMDPNEWEWYRKKSEKELKALKATEAELKQSIINLTSQSS